VRSGGSEEAEESVAAVSIARTIGGLEEELDAVRRALDDKTQQVGYSDEQVANRDIRVWHGATENGP
jgi:hypothetical protein